eukprot:Skav226925  [mRNA]  locus=scaffold3728:127940:128911:- [translate_table: standard]
MSTFAAVIFFVACGLVSGEWDASCADEAAHLQMDAAVKEDLHRPLIRHKHGDRIREHRERRHRYYDNNPEVPFFEGFVCNGLEGTLSAPIAGENYDDYGQVEFVFDIGEAEEGCCLADSGAPGCCAGSIKARWLLGPPLVSLSQTGSNVTSLAVMLDLAKDGQQASMSLTTDIIAPNVVAVEGVTNELIGVDVLGLWRVILLGQPGARILSDLNFTTGAGDCAVSAVQK